MRVYNASQSKHNKSERERGGERETERRRERGRETERGRERETETEREVPCETSDFAEWYGVGRRTHFSRLCPFLSSRALKGPCRK